MANNPNHPPRPPTCPTCGASDKHDRRAIGLSYSVREPFCQDEWHGPDASKYYPDSAGGSLPPSMTATPSIEKELAELREQIGRIMHRTWTNGKRAQGFIGPFDVCPKTGLPHNVRFPHHHDCKYHADLIPWEALPEKQQDFNRHAFDAVLESGILVSRAALLAEAAERKRLKQWVADLQSGMYVNCVYCGHRYGPSAETPVAMAEVLKAHIAECPEHPLSEAVRLLKGASHGFRSYQYGNAAMDLATEMADAIDEFVGRMLTRPRYRDRGQTTDVPIEDGIPSQAE